MSHFGVAIAKVPMTSLRTALLVSAALLACAGASFAQAPSSQPAVSPGSTSLPSGLIRQNGVIMMAPISDSDAGGPPELQVTGERRTALVRFLPAADHDTLVRAFEAADHGDWTSARGLADQCHDLVGRKVLEWRYLIDKNSGAAFAEISQFLKDNPDWPDRDTLFARGEQAIDPAMDPRAALAWFGGRDPVTGIGKIRLGEALIATNSETRGRALVRQGWIEGSFQPDQEVQITLRHGDLLTPDVDSERLAHLLWHNDIGAAKREIARVTSSDQRIAQTRIALRSSPSLGARMLNQLPDSSRDDPGLLFDQAHMLRQQGALNEVPPLLTRSTVREMAKVAPTRWWGELNVDARASMDQGAYHNAYLLTANTGLAGNLVEHSEAEFMAGWIALRFLNDPATALTHFKNLAENVTRPISRARAHYWEGRAYESQGDLADAWQQYHLAAGVPESFYGQLALAKIQPSPVLHLPDPAIDAAPARADYNGEEQTHAVRVLADLGLESLLRSFSVHDADTYPDAKHVKLLAEDLTRMGYPEIALRVAKEAGYSNVTLLAYTHPIVPVPGYGGQGVAPDPAYVLGVIRQETEFDPDVVSGPGARGIMQIMPYSARHDASMAGVDYRPNDLLSDTTYNMRLGMAELAGYLSDWGGSYVLAAAAYNAGPNNAKKWIAEHGDPRNASVDPIDWIEEIPFSETRDYVMRVLENMEVYRNRLSGRDEPLRILTDLYKPNAPQAKVLDYTPPVAAPAGAATVPVPIPKPAGSNAS
jgi:soluble lytic murein transglycosylase